MKKIMKLAATAVVTFSAVSAWGQIKIGVVLSTTGPAASLGIPERNTVQLMPKTIGGQSVEYIVLDDASDTTSARRNTDKLISENQVDVIIGTTTTPGSLAMLEVVGKAGVPLIALGSSDRIIGPQEGERKWAFKTPFGDMQMALKLTQHMAAAGAKTVGFIGFNDAYGESWSDEFTKMAHLNKMKPVVSERYNRNDTSVTAQVLKIISANPDAVLIGASGTPGVLPQKTLIERGYRGKIYHTHGVLNKDFLRVGGKDVEGALAPAAPVLVADELPATHPVKKVATAFKQLYEGKYGPDSLSPFAANAWDAYLLIEGAIPRALKKAKPGTADFRKALRDEMEATKNLTATQGVINMSPQDHLGFALDAPVMVVSKGGRWMLAK